MRASCIYEGYIHHRRRTPVEHTFAYRTFLMYLDLEEMDDIFRNRWLWSSTRPAPARFRREDYLGDASEPLDTAVRNLVEQRCGTRPEGPIRLLTHLRYFGYVFNPVSFYYCFDRAGEQVASIVAEVHNTPWGERHAYVLDRRQGEVRADRLRFRFRKAFHVSPFMGMDVDYDWQFGEPADHLTVQMLNTERGRPFFQASMTLERREISTASLARVLLRYPMMTAVVTAGIYYQALRLWMKRAPFHSHPGTIRTEVR